MNAEIINIGDEILIGQIVNTNATRMSEILISEGIKITKISVVSDNLKDIIDSLHQVSDSTNIVLITGGLGPTKDDVTKTAIADFLECDLVYSENTFTKIEKRLKERNITIRESHREQCFMPSKVELLNNNLGTAPGMYFKKEDKIFISMPGVPYEMNDIMTHEVIPILRKNNTSKFFIDTLMLASIAESDAAAKIKDIEDNVKENTSIAYLPSLGILRIRLTTYQDVGQDLKKYHNEILIEIYNRLQKYVFAQKDVSLESVVANICIQKKLTISTAESCTGGMISERITGLAGSSEYYLGSIISYSNEAKMKLLNVQEKTLLNYGAVSEETVIEMVHGACDKLNSDVSVAISGIAGPSGGTPEKPVGTIWIAVGNKNSVKTSLINAGDDRMKNRIIGTNFALNELRKFLEQI
ncbi:MAG TPA: CinA family nicotinamide mononucleotide deamidase-related protein [Saprospiraceae bacterium]|nr:CinA family nicotinamide mononucleotide deamidase-related protein [Saprospiraceae bacterium]